MNILIAYPYFSKKIIDTLSSIDNVRLLIDSGAFTAWNSGKKITLDEYCTFLEKLPFKPFGYFSLDVIGDKGRTLENYKEMLKRGFNPIPVLTYREDFNTLDNEIEFYLKNVDYIGLGGFGKAENRYERIRFIREVKKKIGDRGKIHLLGFTKTNYIMSIKPFSVDSTSWNSSVRFGVAYIYIGNFTFQKIKKSDWGVGIDNRAVLAVKKMGFNLSDFLIDKNWESNKSIIEDVNIKSWLLHAKDIEKHFNTKVFLAVGSHQNLSQIIKNWEEIR